MAFDRRKRPARRVLRLIDGLVRVTTLTVVGFLCWAVPATPFLTVPGPAMDPEIAQMQLAAASLGVDNTVTDAVTATPVLAVAAADPFHQTVFRGPNRAAKRDRARPRHTAIEIAELFAPTRIAIAEARLDKVRKEAEAARKAADDKKAEERRLAETEQRIRLAALSGRNVNSSNAALDAISALSGEVVRDPSIPFPVAVPRQLAYARDSAPETVHRGTMQPALDVSAREFKCMAEAIYFEARSESYRGQVAVGQVVRNRVKHKAYPGTICAVVYQNQTWRNRCQFSFACDGIPEHVNEPKAWAQAEKIARDVIDGNVYLSEVANATHYHATYVSPHWAPRMKRVTRIGLHVFYRFRGA